MINYTLAIKWTKGETVSIAGFFLLKKYILIHHGEGTGGSSVGSVWFVWVFM